MREAPRSNRGKTLFFSSPYLPTYVPNYLLACVVNRKGWFFACVEGGKEVCVFCGGSRREGGDWEGRVHRDFSGRWMFVVVYVYG